MADVASLSRDVNYSILVKCHDILGWQNFIEGRLLSYMVQIQDRHLQDLETLRTAIATTKTTTSTIVDQPHILGITVITRTIITPAQKVWW